MDVKYGVLTVIVATLVVFTILFISLIMLKSFGKWLTETRSKYLERKEKKLEFKAAQAASAALDEEAKELGNSEELAAIAMALHLYLNANRDEESEVITFDTLAPRYSPWAQKGLVMKRVVKK
ncbi:MAG: hypothetical protein FWC34_09440 [Bacteroidetes bacterium]|nr:hypothetical protein [Bacteroidota bacterium]MCL2303506.1 hypothetical protein [Lentimicrobiaceae bacterium]